MDKITKKDISSGLLRFVQKEMQTFISVFYILMVGIGMLFKHQKYSEFGINIFDYADIFDFLVAPFSDNNIIIFSLISTIIPLLVIRFDIYWKDRFPKSYSKANLGWDRKPWFNTVRFFTFFMLLGSYIYIAADVYGRKSKEKIEKEPVISVKFVDNTVEKGIVIGKTAEIIFLFNDGKVKAIPITSSVKEIEIK